MLQPVPENHSWAGIGSSLPGTVLWPSGWGAFIHTFYPASEDGFLSRSYLCQAVFLSLLALHVAIPRDFYPWDYREPLMFLIFFDRNAPKGVWTTCHSICLQFSWSLSFDCRNFHFGFVFPSPPFSWSGNLSIRNLCWLWRKFFRWKEIQANLFYCWLVWYFDFAGSISCCFGSIWLEFR